MNSQPDLAMGLEPTGPPDWIHRHADINDVCLHYVECGTGPLVILLHGFPEFWYAWRRQIPALASWGFRVIALDQRGYNTSAKPKGVSNYRMEALVDDVLGIIHAAGEQSAVVVGHDWGGVIAWTFAMRHPQAVEKLIILNAPHPQRFLEDILTVSQLRKSWYILLFQLPWLPERLIRAGDFAGLERILRRDPVHPDTFDAAAIEQYKRAIAQPGALTAAINYYRALIRCNPLKLKRAICRIDTPTLVIWGEQDRYLGVRLAQGLEPWVPNLKLELIPDASHWVQVEVPERVNEVIIDFLRTAHDTPPRIPHVRQHRLPQTFEPSLTDGHSDPGFDDDRDQRLDGAVHRRTDCAGGPVDVLQRGRHVFSDSGTLFGRGRFGRCEGPLGV